MPRSSEESTPRSSTWFWWLLANLLALSFAVLSWTLLLEVFGRPEVPRNYKILRMLDRLPEHERFAPKDAPEGRLMDPEGLYGWFFRLGEERYRMLNRLYRRNYLRNYDGAEAVSYVEGEFEVLQTRHFNQVDFLPHGFAIQARALTKPSEFTQQALYPVVIELLVPTLDATAAQKFPPGSRLSLKKAPHLPVIMDVGRDVVGDEPVVRVTLMPIGYGRCALAEGGSFPMTVPEWVRPSGKLSGFPSPRMAGAR